MHLLSRWIGLGQNGTRLAQAETQLAEYPLALTNLQLDAKRTCDPRRKRLAVPQIDVHARIARFAAQRLCHRLHLRLPETRRAAGSLGLAQSG